MTLEFTDNSACRLEFLRFVPMRVIARVTGGAQLSVLRAIGRLVRKPEVAFGTGYRLLLWPDGGIGSEGC
jgi:hypothetical protein